MTFQRAAAGVILLAFCWLSLYALMGAINMEAIKVLGVILGTIVGWYVLGAVLKGRRRLPR